MVTIHHLEVQFDVAGDGDEAVFARLFEQYMRRYRSAEQVQQKREQCMQDDCRLDDQPHGDQP